MKTRLYTIPEIGKIEVCKHHSTKKLTIKVKSNAIPRVVIPQLMTYNSGYIFAVEKKEWIKEALKRRNKALANSLFAEGTVFKTRFNTIVVKTHSKRNLLSQYEDGKISVYYPEAENPDNNEIQTFIKNVIINILRTEAKMHLIPRVKELADKYNFNYKKVFVKNMKTRWGSCSGQNNINLNIHLMRLPEYLSDFIILHELCHTVHKNHGEQFHQLLNSIVGDEKRFNKELKNYTTNL